MGKMHMVEQGECLSSLAHDNGFSDWHVIYDDPQNADFRQQRPNPNIIYPGDTLFIPDIAQKAESGGTETNHLYKLQSDPTILRIILDDETGEPFANREYELTLGDLVENGTTDGDGKLEHPIPPNLKTGKLVIWRIVDEVRTGITWNLEIGGLDPVEKMTGIQARLDNLGYDCGKVDGIQGPITTAAVKEFQEDNKLTVDGIVGPQTRGKLKEIYGC